MFKRLSFLQRPHYINTLSHFSYKASGEGPQEVKQEDAGWGRQVHSCWHLKGFGGHLGHQLPFLIWRCSREWVVYPGSYGFRVQPGCQAWWNFPTSLPSLFLYFQWETAPPPHTSLWPLGSNSCALQIPSPSPLILWPLMAFLNKEKGNKYRAQRWLDAWGVVSGYTSRALQGNENYLRFRLLMWHPREECLHLEPKTFISTEGRSC